MVYGSCQILTQAPISADGHSRDNSAEANSFIDILGKSLDSFQARTDLRKASNFKDSALSPVRSERIVHETKPKTPAVSSGTAAYESRTEFKDADRSGIAVNRGNNGMKPVSEEEDISPVKENAPEKDEILKQSGDIQYFMDEIIAILQKFTLLIGRTQSESDQETVLSDVNMKEVVQLMRSLEANLSELVRIGELYDGKTAKTAVDYADRMTQALNEILTILSEGGEITIQNTGKLNELVGKMLNETEYAKMNVVVNSIQEAVTYDKQIGPAADSSQSPDGVLEQAEMVPAVQNDQGDDRGTSTFSGNDDQSSRREINGEKALSAAIPRHRQPKLESAGSNAEIPLTGELVNSVQGSETIPTEIEKVHFVSNREVLQQVVEKIGNLQSEGKSELVIQLKPESLGKISLRLIHERGEIIARFVTENEQVKAILESNMQFLRDSLQRSGVSVQSLSVSVGQHEQRQGTGYREEWNREPEADGRVAQAGTGRLTANAYIYRGLGDDVLQPVESEINLTA